MRKVAGMENSGEHVHKVPFECQKRSSNSSSSNSPPKKQKSDSVQSGTMEWDSGAEDFDYDEDKSLEDSEIFDTEDILLENQLDESCLYKVLSAEEVVKRMNEAIKDANSVLQLSPTAMRLFMNHFKWDKNRLMEAYYDSDQEKLLKDAKVKHLNGSKVFDEVLSDEDCEICFSQPLPCMKFGMDCGHQFCLQCWEELLAVKIGDEGMSQTIPCPEPKCPLVMDDASVLRLLTDEKVKTKYTTFMVNHFVQCNRLMRACPAPGCSKVVMVQYNDWKPVTCDCGCIFCFKCGDSWHAPIQCVLLQKWQQKCKDDSETCRWLVANTKTCPKCHISIEKNGGCNHMSCTNQSCQLRFCWQCMKPLQGHDDGSCNRFDDEATKTVKGSARMTLERYLHYWNRYRTHEQSLNFEAELVTKVEEKMEEMQKQNLTWTEVQSMKKAFNILGDCRKTLMYTFAFAFYLEKTNETHLFEDNQRDLEQATETLSELLEQEMDGLDLVDLRLKAQDKSLYCQKRREVLLQHVYDGYKKNSWTFKTDV